MPRRVLRTVTISMNGTQLVVEFWSDETLVKVVKYDGMTTAFRFSVCNFLEGN